MDTFTQRLDQGQILQFTITGEALDYIMLKDQDGNYLIKEVIHESPIQTREKPVFSSKRPEDAIVAILELTSWLNA